LKKAFYITIILALVFAFSLGCEETEPERVEENDVEETMEEEGDEEAMEEEQKEEKADETFAVGETVEMGNLEFTLQGARWEEGDEFMGPDEGERWLVLDCNLENKGEESEHLSSMMMFTLYDEENYSCDMEIAADTRGSLDGELGSGRSMSGEIAFNVDADHSKWELVFEPNAFGFGQAIFEIHEDDVE